MVGLRHNNQIIDGIIKSISINMMDYFVFSKFPSNMNLHDIAMLKDTPTIDCDFFVSIAVDSSFPMRINKSFKGVAKSFESLVMQSAEPLGFMGIGTTFNCAKKSSLSLGLSYSMVRISAFADALEMFGAKPPTSRGGKTTFHVAFPVVHIFPPCQDGLSFEKTFVKRGNGVNRVNSGNPKSLYGYGNPEPSQGYTPGRCRDYWRGPVPLMTSKSTRLERDEIVHAHRNMGKACNRTDPEKVFIIGYNSTAGAWANGYPVRWD